MLNLLKSIAKSFLPNWIRTSPSAQRTLLLVRTHLLRRKLKQQLRFLRPYCPTGRGGKRVLVPLIETNHYQHYQILIIAKALQLRGADVRVIVCGQGLPACEIRSCVQRNDRDPCLRCRINTAKILPLFNLEVIYLSGLLTTEESHSVDRIHRDLSTRGSFVHPDSGISVERCVEDSTVRHYYGGNPDDREQEVRSASLRSAIISLETSRKMQETFKPDILFSNMNVYSEWEPYFRYFASQGVYTATVSITPLDFTSVRFNLAELFKSTARYRRYVAHRGGRHLTREEREDLYSFLRRRSSGSAKIFQTLNCYQDQGSGFLKLNKAKRNVFLFSNLAWDIGISDQAGLYKDTIDFVFETIRLVANRQDIHLYVKPHPVEKFGTNTRKGVADYVGERYPVLPSNVTLILPEQKVSPYDLFPLIDVGVVFAGTLGLEMVLKGISVISTGVTSHQGLGFAAEPKTEAEYATLLYGDTRCPPIDQNELELFAYFYFIRSLIPWNLTKQAYADDFHGFEMKSLEDLLPGRNPQLDHLCGCILDHENTVPEAWPEISAQAG